MRKFIRRPTRSKSEAGLTMIELLIATLVFVVCMLGIVPLFIIAVGNNGRSKLDTTSTELAQSVIEQISAVLARGGPPSIQDCGSSAPWTINTDLTPSGEVPLTIDGKAIDFTAAQVPGYSMNFFVCGDSPVKGAIYDVRWRIDKTTGTDCTNTCLITVSARPKNMGPKRFYFALPVTLKTYVGPQ